MSTSLLIDTRRYRFTLWEAETTTLKPLQELCEIVSFSTSFSLNQIPNASVTLAHGTEVHKDEPSKILDHITQMVLHKTPVCIVLEVGREPMHARGDYISNENKIPKVFELDPFQEYSENNKYIVFKGYCAAQTFNKTSSSINTTLHIVHWLFDLSAVSPYCPRSHVANPYTFCIYINQLKTSELGRESKFWSPLFEKLNQKFGSTATPWDIVAACLESIIEKSKDTNDALIGSASEIYRKNMKEALGRFKNELAWAEDIKVAVTRLVDAILTFIGQEAVSEWVSTTAWDAIINKFNSMFYMAMSPTVDHVYVIPMPNSIAKAPVTIYDNAIYSINVEVPTTPVLGGVVLVAYDGIATEYGVPKFQLSKLWPPRKKVENSLRQSTGGPLLTLELPQWLAQSPIRYNISEQADVVNKCEGKLEPTSTMKLAESDERRRLSDVDTVAMSLTKFAYLSKVFVGRRMELTMPFRLDLLPGTAIHVIIDDINNKREIDLYGSIETVGLDYGGNSAQTTVVVTNIRNKDEYESTIYNEGPVFYDKLWVGHGPDYLLAERMNS